ncbi:MAG: hypothetical protein KDK76_02095 [Chlamydiia bacterium]|nr:hypothetical protein [Chlamydiia bacterium]
MSIEEVNCETPVLGSEFYSTDFSEETVTEEATTSYQDPGVNSGMTRLVQEEGLYRSITSNLRTISHTAPIGEICKGLTSLISELQFESERDAGYLLVVQKIAPSDPILAKTFITKIQDIREKALGYLELSKYQEPKEATLSLQEAKKVIGGQNPYFYAVFGEQILAIYEEEKRRNFPEAEKTLQDLYQSALKFAADVPDYYGSHLMLARVQFFCSKPELHQTLFKTYELIKKGAEQKSTFTFLGALTMLIEMAAEGNDPHLSDYMQLLRTNAQRIHDNVYSGELKCLNSIYPDENKIGALMDIVELEMKYPVLKPYLEEDFLTFIRQIQSSKQKHPNDSEKYDFNLEYLISHIVSYQIDYAERAFVEIGDPWWQYNAMIDLFMESVKHEGYNKEEEIARLIARYEKEFSDEPNGLLLLLPALVEGLGLEKALPYLEKGKQLALKESDPEWQQNLLIKILEFEVAHNLEGQKETIEAIKAAISKSKWIDENAVFAVIKAELLKV